MSISERMEGAPRRGLFRRLVYWLTRRKLGRVAMPVQIHAHNGWLLLGYGLYEQSLAYARRVEPALKDLAQMRVAGLVGCPF
jgi:hypothetical protein